MLTDCLMELVYSCIHSSTAPHYISSISYSLTTLCYYISFRTLLLSAPNYYTSNCIFTVPLIDYESWYYYISFHTVLLYQQLLVYVRIITLYTKAYQSAGSIFQCSTIILPDNVFQCFKGHICIDMA